MPVQFAQVVGDAAGADQQDVFLAQLRQGLAHPFLQLRAHLAGERDLYHGDVGRWIHQ
ncbi:hypothetical protein D3C85_1860900 [compost metagenome]